MVPRLTSRGRQHQHIYSDAGFNNTHIVIEERKILGARAFRQARSARRPKLMEAGEDDHDIVTEVSQMSLWAALVFLACVTVRPSPIARLDRQLKGVWSPGRRCRDC